MCWTSTTLQPLESDGNVKVFKVCGQRNKSHIYGYFRISFEYHLNSVYETQVGMRINPYTNVYYGSEGFHSYSAEKCKHTTDTASKLIKIYPIAHKLEYPEECRNIVYSAHYADFDSIAIVEGYIPKGSTYYINEYGEIISERIVLTKIANKTT